MNRPLMAKDFMVTRLVTLSPNLDVYDAINMLLSNKISGAPVIDEDRNLLGVLSERCCMRVLIDAAYENMPTTEVHSFMVRDVPTITEETDLLSIAQMFYDSTARRLPVVRDGKLVGQVSRRDILAAIQKLHSIAPSDVGQSRSDLLYLSSLVERNEAPIS